MWLTGQVNRLMAQVDANGVWARRMDLSRRCAFLEVVQVLRDIVNNQGKWPRLCAGVFSGLIGTRADMAIMVRIATPSTLLSLPVRLIPRSLDRRSPSRPNALYSYLIYFCVRLVFPPLLTLRGTHQIPPPRRKPIRWNQWGISWGFWRLRSTLKRRK